MAKIIGRVQEKERLQKILKSKQPAFLAVYGRRRIGKTYLIKNFFEDKGVFFHLTGIQDANLDIQLQNFAVEFSDVFLKGKAVDTPKNWFAAFQMLRKQAEKTVLKSPLIIFFDEVPWLATARSRFVQALDHLWNRYLSHLPNVILIVCGSAASWMIDHILHHRGGLYGRITHEMRLLPFSLAETEEFLKEQKILLDRKQILELYMCLGGVAKYLSYIERGKSVPQSIGEICFSYNAPLIAEFHKLYRSLFHAYEDHIAIVTTLAATRSGLSYRELLKRAGFSAGGTLSKRLEELKQSGFIAEIPLFNAPRKGTRYLLIDEYSLFYLTWCARVSSLDLQRRGASYWLKKQRTPSWKAWAGLSFESLCLKHLEGIKAELGISAVETRSYQWRGDHAQIDLVIDRADNCMHLCEIKFSSIPFVVTKEYAKSLELKKQHFEESTGSQKSLFTTLITAYGAVENSAYTSVVDQQLKMDALFC